MLESGVQHVSDDLQRPVLYFIPIRQAVHLNDMVKALLTYALQKMNQSFSAAPDSEEPQLASCGKAQDHSAQHFGKTAC